MPQIAVINDSTVIDNEVIRNLLPAFSQQWNRDLKATWRVEDAIFKFIEKGNAPISEAWWVVFLDDSNQAGALAYHDLTNDGQPISKIFVKSILQDGAEVSVGATHEVCEMAVDPWINAAYQDIDGAFWSGEICDPVEDGSYGYKMDNILVSDFVTPNWFGHKNAQGPTDFQGHTHAQFEILSRGYAQKFDPQKGWQQSTGALARQSKWDDAARGSRRERRFRGPKNWTNSDVKW